MNLQNPRLVLLLIVALFGAPLLLAVLMRSEWWDFRPAAFSNRGVLVQPPVRLDVDALEVLRDAGREAQQPRPQWSVLYPLPGECGRQCRKDVSGLRQLHIATGRNRDRVAILLLAQRHPPAAVVMDLRNIYPEFVIAVDAGGATEATLPQLSGPGESFGDRRAFLVDPPGNIILGYLPGFDPSHINKDLKRLLTWSAQDDSS